MTTTVCEISASSDHSLRQINTWHSRPVILKSAAAALLSVSLWAFDASGQTQDGSPVVRVGTATDTGERGEEKPRRRPDAIESCKDQADGLSGPKRSRFFTKCLKDDRKARGAKAAG